MNIHTLKTLLCLSPLAIACTAACTAQAQDLVFGPPELLAAELATPMADVHMLFDGDDTVAFAAGELHRERVVKGAPYCADAIQESVQPLADGNRIVRKQSTRLCRDGEGRTRQEVERGGRKIVYLRDPVSQQIWVLDPERKTARRLGLHMAGHSAEFTDGAAWREYGDKMREWAKNFREQMKKDGTTTAPTPPAPPAAPAAPAAAMPVVITEESREVRDAGGKPRKDVQVQVIRIEGAGVPMPPLERPALPALPATAPLPPIAALPPGVAFRAQIGAPRGPGATTSLGTKDIEGVKANGERTTWTIEAGKVGNEKPIVITRDVWTSPDLMVTVLSKDSDPRVGETTYRLANLKRGEPEAALMKVPADFQASKPMPWPPTAPKAPMAPSAPTAKG
ncbi:hypothetical protein [Piscinibacter terrae]|uniref:DUF4412 domain-containing protein n=1 Tax=Piscinibacter terrae TaxID=2496871 RepID=A0A3N7HPU6_9BURK|nr:hypothetical protein [Albitalea terrae]RQP24200.1 hypothetical protein DZC73_12845 [Albitalea terrae]